MLSRLNLKSKQAVKREDEIDREAQKILPKFLNFLETDLWNIPITHFVEQNSIVFDREQGDASVYKNVHKKYAQLVDTLIESYCHDVGVIGEKLVNALKTVTKTPAMSYKEKVLLEPIIASQDFNVFVPMMMRKNVELQLQALKMIEHIHELPTSLKLDEEDEKLWNVLFDEDESERLILISVLKQSKAEWERDERLNEVEWQRQLEEAKRHSLAEREVLLSMREKEQKCLEDALNMNECFNNMVVGDVKADDQLPTTSSKSAENSSNNEVSQKDIKLSELKNIPPPKVTRPSHYEENEKDDVGNASSLNKFDYRNLLKEKDNSVPQDVLHQRALYLREQRDKLMAKKRKERERQLNESTKSGAFERPKTAKAARDAMEGELESRRSIAAKIKANIMDALPKPDSATEPPK